MIEQLVRARCVQRAGRDFWLGELHQQPVVLALSRIGKVAAATTATTLIEAFGVARVVFTGVAGGVGAGVNVGDVVVATEFMQHDMDASPIFPRYQVPLYDRERFACDDALSAMLLEAASQYLTRASDEFDHLPAKRFVHHGLIASGDRFVSAAVESNALHLALTGSGFAALAVEMEGAAVAQACFDYKVPFAAIRTISDRADDQAHVDFPRFVSEVASRYARSIIEDFLRKLPSA